MSITYGFYNSVNGDRKYNAEQMSSIFDGLITDGVFAHVGECFAPTIVGQMRVAVDTGRAWFNGTWTYNDTLYPIVISPSDPILDREDLIVIEINKKTRQNSIVYLEGKPASGVNVGWPSYAKGEDGMIYQYPIASVYVKAGVETITSSQITHLVGQGVCPYVTGILDSVSIDSLLAHWDAEFTEWFDGLHDILDEEPAVSLANRILELENRIDVNNHPAVFELSPANCFQVDGDKKVPAYELPFVLAQLRQSYDGSNGTYEALVHRTTYRGALLGNSVTPEQIAAIKDGTFKNLWLGDYWVIKGYTWRIVDFDYWYKTGDSNYSNHHVVLMPDAPLYDYVMNDSNTTDGGYAGSKMHISGLLEARTLIEATFGDYVIKNRREYLTNAVTDGHPSGGAWYTCSAELPNEIMIFGSYIFTPNSDGSIDISRYTTNTTQLALFAFTRDALNKRSTFWLRDVVNSKRFAFVSENGEASYTNASNSRGVRPVFAIG